MKRAFGFLAATAALGLAAAPAEEPLQEQIAEWVRLLGDNDWRLREWATNELNRLGAPAVAAVQAAAHRGDAEVRARAEKLLRGWRGFLGVTVRTTQLGENRAVQILEVLEGSAAEKAGMQAGDVLLSLNGRELNGTEELVARICEHFVGQRVVLAIRRGDEEKTIPVLLGRRPPELDLSDFEE